MITAFHNPKIHRQADGRYGPALRPDIDVSFEFFPPKTEKMEETLWSSVQRLEPMRPRFVSVTYGAGGSTRERTHATVARILKETSLTPAAHLTCVGATREDVMEVADQYWQEGIRHIVALRGDPPDGDRHYTPHPGGFAYAADLVAGLRAAHDFEISVAAYPEVHPEAKSPEADLDNLKRKIDAGATRAITQFFFEPEHFYDFMDRAVQAGITVPIVPGVVPVVNFTQIAKFANMCGAYVPDWLAHRFEGLEEDAETRRLVAATVAADMCNKLYDFGAREFHFYTLNRADLTYAICHVLGLRPEPAASPAPEKEGA